MMTMSNIEWAAHKVGPKPCTFIILTVGAMGPSIKSSATVSKANAAGPAVTLRLGVRQTH